MVYVQISTVEVAIYSLSLAIDQILPVTGSLVTFYEGDILPFLSKISYLQREKRRRLC